MVKRAYGYSERTRVAVYARFSCDKQRDASIEDQVHEATLYCEERGYEIVRVYSDYAISGRSDDRPQFLAMIDDSERGIFEVVLVWKIDRFARNMEDQYYYQKILSGNGVRIESVKEKIGGNSIEASLSQGMLALFAQLRSQQGSEDVMRGMLNKARACQYLGYKWLGYTHDGDTIILDPATAPIAREVHDRYMHGQGVGAIVDWLNEIGVRGRNDKSVGGNYVTGILKNLAYAGVYTWGIKKNEAGKPILDANGAPVPLVRVDDGIPAIVTKDEKQICLNRLNFRKHANVKTVFPLSGKMFCAECKKPMHGEKSIDKYKVERYRYCCQGKRKACNGVLWKDVIEEILIKGIRNRLSSAKTAESIADQYLEWRAAKKPKASLEAAKADLKAVKRQRDNLIKAVEDGMPYEHVRDRIEKLDAQQAGIERKIAEWRKADREVTKADVLGMLASVSRGFLSDDEILNAFVSEVWVYDENLLAVLNFTGKTSTPYEISCAYEKTRNRTSGAVSSNLPMVDPSPHHSNQCDSALYTKTGAPIVFLENGVAVVIPLNAA